MESKVKSIGELNRILHIPFWLLLILAAANAVVYAVNSGAGIVMTAGLAIYVFVLLAVYYRKQSLLINEMITFATQYGQVQKQLMLDFPFPYALTDENGHLLWFNNAFAALTGKDSRHYQKPIATLFPASSLKLMFFSFR